MPETSASLFERLRQAPDADAWERLVDLYTPLIREWLSRHALTNDDVEDVVQEVMAVLVRKLPDFQREPRTGSFRRWLRTITVHRVLAHHRARQHRPKAIGGPLDECPLAQLNDHQERTQRPVGSRTRPPRTPPFAGAG